MSLFSLARIPVEYLYDGICTVYVLESSRDEESGQTVQSEAVSIENLPCRLSYENEDSDAAQKALDTVYEKTQKIKLFTSPEADIKPGSKIVVSQNGKTQTYKSTGEPLMYASHQEIVLDLFERWT